MIDAARWEPDLGTDAGLAKTHGREAHISPRAFAGRACVWDAVGDFSVGRLVVVALAASCVECENRLTASQEASECCTRGAHSERFERERTLGRRD